MRYAQPRDSNNPRRGPWCNLRGTPPATPPPCLSCHSSGGTAAGFTLPAFPISAGDVHALGSWTDIAQGEINCRSRPTPATNGHYKRGDCTISPASEVPQWFHYAGADPPAAYDLPDTPTFSNSRLSLNGHAE